MEIRDYVALGALMVVLSFLFINFFENPFIPKAYVKMTGDIGCDPVGLTCWFGENVDVSYSMDGYPASSLPELAWYCGWGHGELPKLDATITVQYPDSTEEILLQESKTACNTNPLEFKVTVPLTKGYGIYIVTGKLCGESFWGGWTCDEETIQISYGGY